MEMAAANLTVLDFPARKVFVKHLKKSKQTDSNNQWQLQITPEVTLSLRVVWIQGTVIKMNSKQHFSLDDGTGIAEVRTVTNIPGGTEWVELGKYLMVIGEFLGNDNSKIKIQSFKVMDILRSESNKSEWSLQVTDFHNYLIARKRPI